MKKVLIFSKGDEVATNEVMMWLQKLPDIEILRINDEDNLTQLLCKLSIQENDIVINCQSIETFDSIWIYRGQLPKFPIRSKLEQDEFGIMKEYVLRLLEQSSNCIGSVLSDLNHNKLIDLQIARNHNLSIPSSWVLTSKEELTKVFLKLDGRAIVKPLKNYYTEENDNNLKIYDIFELKSLENIEDDFFPSLVQEKIDKAFEVRSFFLQEKFYSIAIFSQLDEETSLSFKNINRNRMNRMVPFNLPETVAQKLTQIFKVKKLNSGSVDLIYGKDEIFYFLEINPGGQFNWASEIGNFHIEKEIANRLSI